MKTVCVSGRVPMALSMSKYCVISSKSTTSFDDAPLICSFDVKSLMVTRTVNGTGHTGPSEFCATSI